MRGRGDRISKRETFCCISHTNRPEERFSMGAPDPAVPLSQPTATYSYEHEGDRQFATTLARGLEVLRCFTPLEPLLGNKEISVRTGLPKPTVSRLTYTLTKLGYLRHNMRLGKYQLGSAVLSIGYPLLASMNVRQVARPLMKELADYCNGSVSMGVRDRLNMVYVESSRSGNGITTLPDIGTCVPISQSVIGRAFLAACTPPEREAVLNQMKVKEPESHRKCRAAIDKALEASLASTRAVRIAVILLVAWILQAVAGRIIKTFRGYMARRTSAADELRRIDTVGTAFRYFATVIVVLVAGTLVLNELGISVAPILATAGVAGVAIGFGAQSLIKDYFTGFFLLLEDQVREGDVVEVAGKSGLVEEVTLRYVRLRDFEGHVHFVPNGEIKVVSNRTRSFAYAAVDVGVGYGVDIDQAFAVMREVGQAMRADAQWKGRIV